MLFGKQKDEYEKRSVDLARQCKNLIFDNGATSKS